MFDCDGVPLNVLVVEEPNTFCDDSGGGVEDNHFPVGLAPRSATVIAFRRTSDN